MLEVLQDFVRESEYLQWVEESTPRGEILSTPEHNLKRLNAVSRLRAEQPLFISETASHLFYPPPLRIFSCPYQAPSDQDNQADLGIFLVFHHDGRVSLIYWCGQGVQPGETTISSTSPIAWPHEVAFQENLLSSLYVTWHLFKEPYPKLEVHLVYNREIAECISFDRDLKVTRTSFAPREQSYPPTQFNSCAEFNAWPIGSITPVNGSRSWLFQPAGAHIPVILTPETAMTATDPAPVIRLQSNHGKILAATTDSGGNLWAATSNYRLFRWQLSRSTPGKNLAGEDLQAPIPLIPSALLTIKSSDSEGKEFLLLATHGRGLHLIDPTKNFFENAGDIGNTYRENVYLPGTILQAFTGREDRSHVLLLFADGRMAAVRIRDRDAIREKFSEIFIAVGFEEWTWEEVETCFKGIKCTDGKLFPHPGLVISKLWDRVLGEPGARPTEVKQARETWRTFFTKAVQDEEDIFPPDVRPQLRRYITDVLCNTPNRSQSSLFTSYPELGHILRHALQSLWDLNEEHLLSLLVQRGAFVKNMLGEKKFFTNTPPGLPTLEEGHVYLAGLRVRGIGAVFSSIRAIVPFPGTDDLVVICSFNLHILRRNKDFSYILKTFTWEELGLPSRLVCMLHLDGDNWLLASHTGHVLTCRWTEAGPIESTVLMKESAFTVACGWVDRIQQRVFLGGAKGGYGTIQWRSISSLSQKGQLWTCNEIDHEGRITAFAHTESCLYALDEQKRTVLRMGFYEGIRKFTTWTILESAPQAIATVKMGDQWLILVGDWRGRLLALKEEQVAREGNMPVLAWLRQLPSAIKNIGLLVTPYKKGEIEQRQLVVGTARDGTFIIDLEAVTIRSVLRQTCPARTQVKIDNQTVLVGTVRGELWQLDRPSTLNKIPSAATTASNLKETFDHRHHAIGLALAREENPADSPFFKKVLDLSINRMPNDDTSFFARTLPKVSPPVNRYLALHVAACFGIDSGWEFPTPALSTNRTEFTRRYIEEWLVKQHYDVQALALWRLRLALRESESKSSRAGMATLDAALASWGKKLDLELFPNASDANLESRLENQDKFWHVIDLMVEAVVMVAGDHGGRQCGKLLQEWRDELEQPQAASRLPEKFRVIVVRRVVAGDAAGKDSIRRLGKSWDNLFRINRGHPRHTYSQWQQTQEKWIIPAGCPAFWPEPVWALIDILFKEQEEPDQLLSEFLLWQKEFAEAAHFAPDLEPWLPFIELVAALLPFAEPKKLTVQWSKSEGARLRLIHRELGVWMERLHELIEKFRDMDEATLPPAPLVDALEDIRETFKQVAAFRDLSNLERRFVEVLKQSWQQKITAVFNQIHNNLEVLAARQPELVLKATLVLEKWGADDRGELRLALLNTWVWPLEVCILHAGAPPGIIPLPPRRSLELAEVISVSCNRREIVDNTFLCPIEVTHSMDWKNISATFDLAIRLESDLEIWLGEARLANSIANELKQAVAARAPILLQSTGRKLPNWLMAGLMKTLGQGYGYSVDGSQVENNQPWVAWLRPGETFTLKRLKNSPRGTRWLPLDLPERNLSSKHLLPYLHGRHAPQLSEVTVCAAYRAAEIKAAPLPESFRLLLTDDLKCLASLVWEALPIKLQEWLPDGADKLMTDTSWLFGLETDLRVGHLIGPKGWRGWRELTFPPEGSGLNQESFQAIRQSINRYWDWSFPIPGPENILAILQSLDSLRLNEVLEAPAGWEVRTGEVVLARSQWLVGFFLPLSSTTRSDESADFWENFLAIASQDSKRLWFVITPDQERTRLPRREVKGMHWVDIGPDDLFSLLTWPRPSRALAWRMSMRLPISKLNPFCSTGGLGERIATMFHGRDELIDRLKQTVFAEGRSCLICGARRIGKTSLLQKLRYEWKGNKDVLFLDFQDVTVSNDADASTLFCREFEKKFNELHGKDESFPCLDSIEIHLRKLPVDRRPILLLDELDRLFDKDLQTYDLDDGGNSFLKRRWVFPLFSWLRKNAPAKDADGTRPLLTMVMVSYAEGSTRPHALNQWLTSSGSPLYNWQVTISLTPWHEDEAKDFLRSTLEDLGIFLSEELLSLMVEHSLHIPWVLQEMGGRLLKKMGADPAKVKWPGRSQVIRVILESLAEVDLTIFSDVTNAVGHALRDYRVSPETKEEQKELLSQFWELLRNFAGDPRIFPDEDVANPFPLDRFTGYLSKTPSGKGIAFMIVEQIFDNLNRTIVLNGGAYKQYEFAFGLLPMVVRWQDQLRKELL